METTSTLVNLYDQNLPNPLYKYRCWREPYHHTILTNRLLYFAAPTTFKDELEFRNFVRYDLLTEQQIYDRYFSESRARWPNRSLTEHSSFAMEWTQRAPFKNPDYLKKQQEEQFNRYDERVGVLSLTTRRDNLDMWNYYSNCGEGFCVGFDTYVLASALKCGFTKVEYPPEGLPTVYANDSYEVRTWKQIFNKTTDWAFEEEFRFHIFNPNKLSVYQRAVTIPKEAFLEVVIGWKTPVSSIKAILKAIKQQRLPVDLYMAKKNGESILIDKT